MAPELDRSRELYRHAQHLIPGGVNSPVRRYDPFPLFVASAQGSRFKTVDGAEYLDYCMGYGALLHGHAFPKVVNAVKRAVEKGSIFGQPTEAEIKLASLITSMVPSVEMVRLTSSGTEACLHSIRLARAFTGKRRILKFEGGFHGSYDEFLVRAGSGTSMVGAPSSKGVPAGAAKNTLVAPYNNEQVADKIIRDYGDELAAVIVEPVLANTGLILPKLGFLRTLRKATKERAVVLVFDEVITGFRLSLGGAQQYYGISPDLTVMGKVLGGGLPLSAFGGQRKIMEMIAPSGPVYQAGTFAGNPVSVAAGLATLHALKRNAARIYSRLERIGDTLRKGLQETSETLGGKVRVNVLGSMFQVFFTDRNVTDYQSARSSDTKAFQRYFRALLRSKIFIPPSQFETCFLSASHTRDDVETTLQATAGALKTAARA